MRVYGPKFGELQEPGFQPDGTYIPNEYFMNLAIRYAESCIVEGQHPVGAVVTRTTVLRHEYTKVDKLYEMVGAVGVNEVVNDSSQHAELVALGKAEHYHGRRNLGDLKAVLYTTHEPCPMCAGVVANSKLAGIVYGTGAEDAKELVETQGIRWRSNAVSGLDIIRGREERNGAPEQFIIGGFMRDKCKELLAKASLLGA